MISPTLKTTSLKVLISRFRSCFFLTVIPGTSSHVTSLAGASVQIDFVGSAVSVFGQGAAGAYSTTLDNGSAVTGSPAGSMLATYGGLDPSTKHTLVLKATLSQQLSLSYATFTVRSNVASKSI